VGKRYQVSVTSDQEAASGRWAKSKVDSRRFRGKKAKPRGVARLGDS
jgi:hypothetical protein